MHIGHWLIADSTTRKVFSPWFPRGGDNAIFTYEKIIEIGSPTMTVRVVHKNRDDSGNGSLATAASGSDWARIGSTTFWKATYDGLKELVRFQFELAAGETGNEMVLYRVLAPTWFNTVNA